MNCRIGDLAVVVNSRHSENLGLIVEVIAPARYFLRTTHWRVRSCGRPIVGTNPFGERRENAEADVDDACLRPIRGAPEADEIRELEPHELGAVSATTAHGIATFPA